MSVGERIALLRKQGNISQVQLAKALNISRQAVSKWENGHSLPDMANMILLADLLCCDVEYLSTGRTAPPPSPPVTIQVIKTVDKVVEKVVEKPIIRRITRVKYLRNPAEFVLVGTAGLLVGITLGILIGVFAI